MVQDFILWKKKDKKKAEPVITKKPESEIQNSNLQDFVPWKRKDKKKIEVIIRKKPENEIQKPSDSEEPRLQEVLEMPETNEGKIDLIRQQKKKIRLFIFLDESGSVEDYSRLIGKIAEFLKETFKDLPDASITAKSLPIAASYGRANNLSWFYDFAEGANVEETDPDHYKEAFLNLAPLIKAGKIEGDLLFVGDGGDFGYEGGCTKKQVDILLGAISDAKAQGINVRVHFILLEHYNYDHIQPADAIRLYKPLSDFSGGTFKVIPYGELEKAKVNKKSVVNQQFYKASEETTKKATGLLLDIILQGE